MDTGLSSKETLSRTFSAATVPVTVRESAPVPPESVMSGDTLSDLALSPREQEVLAHLAQGCTYRIIARRMGLSPHTVDTYVRRLRGKTGLVNRIQLAHLAFRLGYGPGY